MSTNSVQHIDLRIMNGALPLRGANLPYAFNPGTNASIATGLSASIAPSAPQDRLIVGVDFGTTYSGETGRDLHRLVRS
jgi:hypothetical protein